jgi:hypothetical protein
MSESGPGEISNLFLNFSIRALNSLSFRFTSFTIPVVGERSINLFFRLLDFSDRNAEVP